MTEVVEEVFDFVKGTASTVTQSVKDLFNLKNASDSNADEDFNKDYRMTFD